MTDAPESLLEVDQIDNVLDAPTQSQPVVVVQYSSKRRPPFLVMGLILLAIGGILFYHHKVVEQLRAQNLASKRDLQSWKERFHIEAVQTDLLPAVPVSTPPPKPTGPTRSHEKTSTSSPASPLDSKTRNQPPVELGKVEADLSMVPDGVQAGSRPPQAQQPLGTAPNPGITDQAQSPIASVDLPLQARQSPVTPIPSEPSNAVKPAIATGAHQPSTLPSSSTPTAIPSADEHVPLVQSPAKPEPTAVASATIPVLVQPDRPLPSKEETLRMIQEEAAQKQEEIRQKVADKAVDVHRLRYEERIRFHQELREALEAHGRNAAQAIEQLCNRYGYEADSRRVVKGSQYWFTSIKPISYKADKIRLELDLPEATILNFIWDGLYSRVRTRDGPRDANEARVRAALLLLNNCKLTPLEETSRSTALGSDDAGGTSRQGSNPTSKGAAPTPPR